MIVLRPRKWERNVVQLNEQHQKACTMRKISYSLFWYFALKFFMCHSNTSGARVLFYHKLFCDGGFVPCLLARCSPACLPACLPHCLHGHLISINIYTRLYITCTLYTESVSQPASQPVHQSASEYYSTGRTHNQHPAYSSIHRVLYHNSVELFLLLTS